MPKKSAAHLKKVDEAMWLLNTTTGVNVLTLILQLLNAGQLRRENAKNEEIEVLIQSMETSIIPKLLEKDIPLFG